MTDVLTTRDGLIGNSPRYTGYISPPYKRFLKDDAGNAINLTGILSSAFSIIFVNQSNPLFVKSGGGIWSIVSPATQGLVSYQYAQEDLDDAGNWYVFVTVQLPGEPSPRAFDPDFVSIVTFPGGLPIVTIQQVDLEQLGGTQISSSNPVPTSGPVTIADGANVSQGATTDSSSASTTIGLLKAIKAYLSGTLTTSGTMTETNSGAILADANSIVTATANASTAIGSVGDAAWSGSGNGSEIAILKKLVAELAATLNVSVTSALPAGTNVIGHVVVDSAGSVSVTSLPSLPAGANAIGHVTVDNATALGQAPMVSSLPVTMASDQSSMPMNLKQINGAALSITNPTITELSTTIASRNAQAFSVAVQKSAIATGYCALSLFNPSNSGKTAYFRIVMADESTSAYHKLYYVTTDPNYNGTNKGSLTPTNLLLGGTASALSVTYSNTGAETDPPGAGSPVLIDILGQNSVTEQFFLPLGSGFEIKCPAGFGLIIYDNAATNNWLAGAKWFEV